MAEELSKEGVIFLDVDIDQNPEVAKKHNMEAFPTFAFFVEKEIDDKFQGADLDKLRAKITAYIDEEESHEGAAE